MVADGRMPPPKVVNARRIWDRRKIDEAFEGLPEAEEGETIKARQVAADGWSDYR